MIQIVREAKLIDEAIHSYMGELVRQCDAAFAYTAWRFERLVRHRGFASSLLSLLLGLFLAYQTGFVHSLFTSHPQWTPG